MATLLWAVTPFQTTVTRVFSTLVEPLNRAARNVMSSFCHVSGAVLAFRSGGRLAMAAKRTQQPCTHRSS